MDGVKGSYSRLLVFAYLIDINHIGICDINSFSDVAESGIGIIYISSIEKEKKKRRRERERKGGERVRM